MMDLYAPERLLERESKEGGREKLIVKINNISVQGDILLILTIIVYIIDVAMHIHSMLMVEMRSLSSRSPCRAWDEKKLSDVSSTLSTAACISSLNLSVT